MMRRLFRLSVLVFAALEPAALAQNAYRLPFAASGNTIELAVANTSSLLLSGVKVEAVNIPSWLRFNRSEYRVALMKPNQEGLALFSFSVDRSAPLNTEGALTFTITAQNGEHWAKEIKVTVAPPEYFELYQNYPNPFNPTTTIAYQLPSESRVALRAFNLLGQEVALLLDEDEHAGYHQVNFDASRLSSGLYVYRLVADDRNGAHTISQRAMLLIK